jgi:16S rRNA (cytidine1402-2'-O)-methyltransferase
MSALYLVATPIGNLKDITHRALEVLSSVDLILAEDTRKTSLLLSKYGIQNRLESFHEHSEEKKIPTTLAKLKSGMDIALASDAGTPSVSDPGFKLVRAAIEEDIEVISIPGPSAAITALVASGLPTDSFLFLGYFPKKTSKQKEIADFIDKTSSARPTTIIFFESPFRIKKTLEFLAQQFPNKQIVIGRELTKIHEEYIRGTIKGVVSKNFTAKGEFTVLLR